FVASTTTCRASGGICDAAENCTGTGATCPADAFVASTTTCRASGGICDVAENCTGTGASCPADAFVASTTQCRAAGGVCDTPENCSGTGAACPADTFLASSVTCRASAGVCDVAENCSGTGAACPADAFVASTTTCRASGGICDVAENCTGTAAACPADAFAASSTTCRTSGGVCDVAENCSGTAAACPADAFVASTTTCRASGGICDVAENCTGTGAGCPADAFVASTTTCRASGGICDAAENCTGTGAACPADAFASSATTCRASSGVCDAAENCTGTAAACPADAFASSSTTCRASGGICDVAETCTGTGAACPANGFVASTTQCRASGGVCDVAETCTGTGAACPADAFVASTTQCRASGGVCDVAENCTGTGAACPADAFVTSTTQCRASGGVCDVAENCTGTGAACPADAFVASTTTCRASGGVCDVAENCTGAGAACPADAFAVSSTTCRASGGVCDVAENCTGTGASCPADAFAASSVTCRASGGVCDVPENCSGIDAACPADAFAANTVTCRASGGVCDVAENCTGAGAACPVDAFLTSATTCRAASGVCDAAETCSGSDASCPVDGFLASTTICRASAGDCDAAEVCTGTAGSCPADGFEPSGTACGDTGNTVCDNPDTCDGLGVCVSNHAPTSTTCRADAGDCDIPEFCDGAGNCPANAFEANGSACGSQATGNCDLPDTCLAGVCQANEICESCSVSIRKVHSGDLIPGGQVKYTLQWTNSCLSTLTNVVVTDALPTGLEFVSATSPGATATIQGNSVTFQMATWAGGETRQAVITTRIGEDVAPGTTIDNYATLSDDAGHTDSANDRIRVRDANTVCPVALKKVHSGNNNPGGEIHYTLQWSNACSDDLTDVTVTDPLPAGLTLLSASSADATATVSGNTATFHMNIFPAGDVGKGFITARIGDDVAAGTGISNLATLTDAAGHSAVATNFFRVRGGSTDTERLSCFVRAQKFARPGRYVKYDLRYKNGSLNNELNLVLPGEVDIVDIYPTPSSQDGNTLHWNNLAATAGRVTVNTLVKLTAQDEAILVGSALMDDGAGETAVCEHVGVVSRYEKLFTALKAQTHTRPGLSIRYTARYREAIGHNEMVVSLPDEVSVIRAIPAPSGGSDKTLVWKDLPIPAGVVKIDARVGNVPDGTVLVGSVTMTDESTDVVGTETQTVVGMANDGGTTGGSGAFGMGLSALRSVTPGTTTDISVRYENLQGPGSVQIVLPPELTAVLAVPGAAFSGNTATWNGLTYEGASLKLRVLVNAAAQPGKTLAISAVGTDASGGTVTSQASTVVRDSSTSTGGEADLAMSLTLTRTVTKGLTSDISASYEGLQGSGQLTITLPPGLTLQSSVPSGASVSGSNVIWSGLTDSSGSVRARVLVSTDLESGAVLPVSGAVSDSSGASGTAAGTTSVR
ncbi:MAG: hypothetical protein ABR538_08440, partial [Candidatus Binatia bacterium]